MPEENNEGSGEEIGRIVGDTADIIVRKTEFQGKNYVDIRKYLHGSKYQGWSTKGISIKIENLNEIVEMLKKVQTGL